MYLYHACSPGETAQMDTEQLRKQFLLESLMHPGQIQLNYTHYDRMIIGGVMPLKEAISLGNPAGLRADFFLERREIGIINVGGTGTVTTASGAFKLDKLDCVYLGKGTTEVHFSSLSADQPAQFFLLSAPAHRVCPAKLMTATEANPNKLGAAETANSRTIYKYIHPDGLESCQLVMGLTILEQGSVWNTMPPHTHDRRMEAYFYFDVPTSQRVLHLMGQPDQTRHLWVSNHQAIISPPWSIHAGSGTMAYSFIWGMAGENQSFTDMDPVSLSSLA